MGQSKFKSIEVALTTKRPCGGRSMETTGAFGGVKVKKYDGTFPFPDNKNP